VSDDDGGGVEEVVDEEGISKNA